MGPSTKIPRELSPGSVRRTEVPSKTLDSSVSAAVRNPLFDARTFDAATFGSRGFEGQTPVNAKVNTTLGELTMRATGEVLPKKRKAKAPVVIRDKRQVLLQCSILIAALQEAYDFRPTPGKNQPPPDLFDELGLSDSKTRAEIAELIAQLKKLNAFLEQIKKAKAETTKKPVVDVRKSLNKALNKYGQTVAKGAGFVTVGVMAQLAIGLGADPALVYTSLAGFFWKGH